MGYNAENRLEKIIITGMRTAYYQYDANGQRVRKTVTDTSSNTTEIRKYVGEWEVYSKLAGSSLNIERETLHISDNTGRIALIDTRTQGTGAEPSQLLRYQYSNHLGSATLELDYAGAIISYEEYYPYGSTSFQSGRSLVEVSLKRYRYTGKERDKESGLYYHGARYYIPWLARWTASDPLESKYAGMSPYNYGNCNPLRFKDPTGNSSIEFVPPHGEFVNLSRLVEVMNKAVGVKAFKIIGKQENFIGVNAIDRSKLNKQQLAFYDLISDMTDSSKNQSYNYKLRLEEIDRGKSGSILASDAGSMQRINMENVENIPKEGKFNSLFVLFHIFSEQKYIQDYFLEKNKSTEPAQYNDERSNFIQENIYIPAHEKALNDALSIFGYRYYTTYAKSNMTDLDLIGPDNKYIETLRITDKDGTSVINEGTTIITIGKEGHSVKPGDIISNPEWRDVQGKETYGDLNRRIEMYYNDKDSFKPIK